MTRFKQSWVLFIVWAALASAQTVNSKPSAAPTGNAETGRKLFMSFGCWACHGREAQGGGPYGPRLGPGSLPYAAFIAYIRAPGGEMPQYTRKLVPDQDIADIYAFVASRPKPRSLQDLPLLK